MNVNGNTQALDRPLTLGIDVGSTTVKMVVFDGETMLSSCYIRHLSMVKQTVSSSLKEIMENHPNRKFKLAITGSAGMGLAQGVGLPFVQEVHGAYMALQKFTPGADAAVELGGEDAKIIFLTNGLEQRMNGSCAGGTGAFIDQMATLIGVTVKELDELAGKAVKRYPIASRCGVFAKSDIQPLFNQGASREDIAASIFQAVVDQTVSGLAQGRVISGNVVFLGGPIFFQNNLREAFVRTLRLRREGEAPREGHDQGVGIFPENALVFVASGAALYADTLEETFDLGEVIGRIEAFAGASEVITDKPLFNSRKEYEVFTSRHATKDLGYGDIDTYAGDAYLGIDAGSTTTKVVLITADGRLLYTHYSSNKGQPLDKLVTQLKEIYRLKNPDINIAGSAVTGYGEELIKAAFSIDFGIVETVAHFKAAQYFCADVDFIIDIGGQDIKCFKIKDGAIDSIMLNEACSSGCGSFLQTFAQAMGHTIEDFASLGLFAQKPVDLGSRCTVFMNSNVKQAQKDGASVEDISAGLSMSVIKNAIYKVIRAQSAEDLGKHIVVQGGTFLNDAVLRAFELELGRDVIRPAIAGLMGAFGAALYAKENADGNSSLMKKDQLETFSYEAKNVTCGGCGTRCPLTVVKFSDGRKFTAGNRCEKGAGLAMNPNAPDCLYERKYRRLLVEPAIKSTAAKGVKVGLPLALGFYEQMPFWRTFFETLGFETIISDESSRKLYIKGQHTIPSDTACYPAKLVHGHILSLLEKGADFIFFPCESYNINEGHSDNHYNCPVVAYYPELLKANIEELNGKNFMYPYIDINLRGHSLQVLTKELKAYGVKKRQVGEAYDAGLRALAEFKAYAAREGQRIVKEARSKGQKIIVLAGRPYHLDPEINHGIHKLITSLGMAVITEDSIYHLAEPPKHLGVLNQWTYHARLYRAAAYVATQPDMQLVQLVSFGCGLDAITTDEVRDILEKNGKFYTQLKIDEVSNLGAAKIRLRSLAAALSAKSGKQKALTVSDRIKEKSPSTVK